MNGGYIKLVHGDYKNQRSHHSKGHHLALKSVNSADVDTQSIYRYIHYLYIFRNHFPPISPMDFRTSFPNGSAPVPSEWHARSGPPTESNAWLPAAFGNHHGDPF